MTDPLSIIGAVLSALHVVKTTTEFTSTIRDAPAVVKAAHNDLTALQTCLKSLHDQVTDPRFSKHPSTGCLLNLVQQPLSNCSQSCDRLNRVIQPYVKFDSMSSGMRRWRSISFGFREKDVRSVQQDLMSCKGTLEVAIGLANFIVGQVASGQVNRIDRRVDRMHAAMGLDIFSDTSTVVGDLSTDTKENVLNWLRASTDSEDEVEQLPRKSSPKIAQAAKLEEFVTAMRPPQPDRTGRTMPGQYLDSVERTPGAEGDGDRYKSQGGVAKGMMSYIFGTRRAEQAPELRPSFSATNEVWSTRDSYKAGQGWPDRKGALHFNMRGHKVEVLEWHRDGWAKARIGQRTGWVPQSLLKERVS